MAIVDRNELRAAADVQLALLIDVGTHTRLPQEADKDYRRQHEKLMSLLPIDG
ncbi:MAG: hypothetical protein ABSB75_09255 [Candidatus Limnocylindrales bacterium]